MLAGTEYLKRHDDVAKIYHQAIGLKIKLVNDSIPYYKYNARELIQKEGMKLY